MFDYGLSAIKYETAALSTFLREGPVTSASEK